MHSHLRRLARPAIGFGLAILVVLGLAGGARAADTKPEHHMVIQVDDNDPAKMNLALNNLANLYEYYQQKGETVQVELVAYGPGLNIFRTDTSPVKARLETLKMTYDNVAFSACGNTKRGMEKAEKKEIALVPEAHVVPAGVVRILELQEQGWSYVKP
ncbi:DsrE family protein [Ferrovibrio xuzhouensis]|uniref:DsrE family protein n=1 Tax=Ferrovibrio xuzhouensis TaxID=1576914 RepID=A0ABV7VFV6_9PROT